jgi:predicted TIM-barrel fold metal-dependent hydrolase
MNTFHASIDALRGIPMFYIPRRADRPLLNLAMLPCSCCPPFEMLELAGKARAATRGKAKSRKAAKKRPAAKPSPRRIDVHHHIAPPAYIQALGADNLYNGTDGSRRATFEWSPAMALEDMDKGGTQTSITSLYAASALANHPDARRIARECNEFAAQMTRDHPGRFGNFATLPMPDVEGCLKEIEYSLDVLKMDGVDMRTSYGKKWLGDETFAPIYEELDRRKAIVYTHPHEPEFTQDLVPGVPGSAIEFCTDTTRTIASLVFSGTASRFPGVRFIFSHGGGVLPFTVERFTRLGERKDVKEKVPKGVLYELKKFYYEVAQAAHPGALSSLTLLVPMSQIMFGTDFPYRTAKEIGKGLVDFGLSAAQLNAINRGNAAKLFPRFK